MLRGMLRSWLRVGIMVFIVGSASVALAMGTAFTYQGQLQKNNVPVTATCNFEFRLFDALTAGTQVGSTLTKTGLAVANGLFTTTLDFGAAAFPGAQRWLGVSAQCTGDTAFTLLSPRQELTPTPYSLNADKVDGYDAATFWRTIGNAGTNPTTNFLGTTDNQALELRVNNTRVLRLEPNATSPNIIAGYSGNSVTTGAYGATISGGGESGWINRVTDDYGTVGGGYNNQAGDNAGITSDKQYATVGGGLKNSASGTGATVSGGSTNTANDVVATVGGGTTNIASNYAATIGGGYKNTASGQNATVGGGQENTASDYTATVGGGGRNTARGWAATVSGGYFNGVMDNYGTVGGGHYNQAGDNAGTTTDRMYATVGGGSYNTASGWAATVPGGRGNTANGDYATAMGDHTTAESYAETALGSYNTDYTPADPTAWYGSDRLFVIGNGTDSARSDALVMLKNGNTTLNGEFAAISAASGDSAAVSGTHAVTDYYGVGVHGQGGYIGVYGFVEPTGSALYTGVSGIASGGSGTNHGVSGAAFGSGTNYGVYGQASGGATNWAGYFVGDLAYTGILSDVSDLRLKENINPLEDAVAKVAALRGIYFNNIGSEQREVGVIAQEVEAVLPEAVKTDGDGYKYVSYAMLTPVLIEAVKSLKAENDTLKAELAQQQATLDLLLQRLAALEQAAQTPVAALQTGK